MLSEKQKLLGSGSGSTQLDKDDGRGGDPREEEGEGRKGRGSVRRAGPHGESPGPREMQVLWGLSAVAQGGRQAVAMGGLT